MLVLLRKRKETIYIGDGVTVTVAKIVGERVELKIDAPRNQPIDRGEHHHERKRQRDLGAQP